MPEQHPSGPWISTSELAIRLRRPESTIRYWRRTGYGPKGTVFGRRVLYRRSDVEAWERQQEQAQAEDQVIS